VEQPIERCLVGGVTVALSDYGLIPSEAECGERRDDLVGAAGYFARRIEVLDSQQPFAAGATRIEIAGSRCDQRPEVQRAGGRRRESPAIAGNDRPEAYL
jgi:hypothetical protein